MISRRRLFEYLVGRLGRCRESTRGHRPGLDLPSVTQQRHPSREVVVEVGAGSEGDQRAGEVGGAGVVAGRRTELACGGEDGGHDRGIGVGVLLSAE